MELIIVISLHLFTISKFSHSYNLDTNSPYMKSILFNESRFGFAVNIFTDTTANKKHILVGAPFDNVNNPQIQSPGALYSCPISNEYMDCTQLAFDEYSNGSLLGYVVDSNSVDGSIYTCAPRYLRKHANIMYTEGACWELNRKLQEVDLIANGECFNSIKKNSQNYEYRNCLTGGALKTLSKKQVLLTSPYTYEGKGLLINNVHESHTNSRLSNYFGFENSISKYQLTGFSMSIGNVYREFGVKTILLGSPGISQYNSMKTELTFGKVILMKLVKNTMEYSSVIFGEQFGSGFGHSVQTMDLNGDGHDDAIVGAPFADNNNGQVFVYWNKYDAGGSVPLDLKNRVVLTNMKKLGKGQFGICLENIGDINKDSIMDLAVGAPFDNDGSGAIYIYLGSKNQVLTLSQKIEARMISPDLRGFGFSMFGRNEDLDSNNYPDLVVGAAVSSHIIGLRTRPIIRVKADNMLATTDMLLPYNFDSLQKCSHDGREIPCMDVTVAIYYYYPHLQNCLSTDESKELSYQLELDLPFIKTSLNKRVYFQDKSNIIKERSKIRCKLANTSSTETLKTFKILFPFNIFFNISIPINVTLKWFLNLTDVPKRNFNGGAVVDLSPYPVLEKMKNELTNQINFGSGCTPQTCKPILTMQPNLALPKDGEDYLLYIGDISKFKLSLLITNIANAFEDRAYRTYIKINVDSKHLTVSSSNMERTIHTPNGLIYSVPSPLLPRKSANITFEFSLHNNFIQSTSPFIFINISLEAMSPQPHLKPISMKIKIKMVADIDLKVVAVPSNCPFYDDKILGFERIQSEEKIGPKLKFTITLSNNIQNSFILSSKLVIYFPFEVAGNPNEVDGQFMLYLLRLPQFSVSTGKKQIYCDGPSLQKATNIIKTRLHDTTGDNSKLKEVLLKNISLPEKIPKLPKLQKDLVFYAKEPDSIVKSDWEDTVVIDCLKSSARCIPIVCDLGPLSRQTGEITLEFDVRIWLYTLIENFLKYKFVFIEIPVYWVPLVNYDIVPNDSDRYSKSVRIVASNFQKPKPAPSLKVVYAVLIAVSVGVILMATIVIILYQCKFFRRQNIANRKRK